MVGLDKTLTFRGGLLGKRGVTFFRGGAGGGGGEGGGFVLGGGGGGGGGRLQFSGCHN